MEYMGQSQFFEKRKFQDFTSEILTMVTLLGEKFNFLCIFMLSVPLTFQNNVNYASTLNIREVRKFYDLGNKSFETDFNYSYKLDSDNLCVQSD